MLGSRDHVDTATIDDYLTFAQRLADRGREIILARPRLSLDVDYKADGSPVTSLDRHIEQEWRAAVAATFPEHGVLGEEFPTSNPTAPWRWIFDPIDGTEEFVHGLPYFGMILGLYYYRQPVVAVIDHPALDLRCSAGYGRGMFENGRRVTFPPTVSDSPLRQPRLALPARCDFARHAMGPRLFDRLASAYPNFRVFRTCYAHTCAATGRVDATLEFQVAAWDLAATRLLVEEAGGRYEPLTVPDLGEQEHYSAIFGHPEAVNMLTAVCADWLAG